MAINVARQKMFVGQFVGFLRAALHFGGVAINEKLRLYPTLAEGHPDLSRTRTTGMDVALRTRARSHSKFSEGFAVSRRKRRQLFDRRRRVITAAALAATLFVSSPSYPESVSKVDDGLMLELSALGKQGDTIARAREQVLEILQPGNACTAWFQAADPDPAEVVRSLHFALEMRGTSYVYGIRDNHGGQFFKHPWAARSIENGGPGSTILLNANGPFFNRTSFVMQMPAWHDGDFLLTVSSYQGNTPEAQITILLHELGHIIGRLPEDDDSLDGRSSRNTSEVLRHCRTEIHAAAHNSPRGTF